MAKDSLSFKQAREMAAAIKSGKVQLIRPDQQALEREMNFINEIRGLWAVRQSFAEKLAANAYPYSGGHWPDAEAISTLLDTADALAREQMRRTVSESMETLVYLERPIPEQLMFMAKLLDVPIPETKPGESVPETNARQLITAVPQGSA